jgi:hypothetical protein
MGWGTELLTWLQRATGIGYLHLPPLNEEPERKNQVEATKRVQENALSLLREISRCRHKNLAMSIEPKRGDDLGRITRFGGCSAHV